MECGKNDITDFFAEYIFKIYLKISIIIFEYFRHNVSSILFIPYALKDHESYWKTVECALKPMGKFHHKSLVIFKQ